MLGNVPGALFTPFKNGIIFGFGGPKQGISMSHYSAELIVIGDELLTGKIKDANTQAIAKWLLKEGFELKKVTLCSDNKIELKEAVSQAWHANHLVMTTGGLGPTPDDITKATLAEVFAGELAPHLGAQEMVTKHYARIDKVWSPETNSYHLMPTGMEPISNPAGLAPGLLKMDKANKKIFMAAPGVPRELKAMMNEPFPLLLDEVFPERLNNQQVMTIRTFGVPEEKIFFELMPQLWAELSQEGKVSSLPQILGVDIHLTFEGDKKDLELKKKSWQEKLKDSPIAANIWAFELISLEEHVIKIASKKGLSLGAAESCTGGLLANRLTNVAGSSSAFQGSLVTYANSAKEKVLGVKEDTLKSFGAVSEATAAEMVKGALSALGCDIAVSLTGIAGPGGGSPDKPVGTVCMGVATKSGQSYAKTFNFKGDRDYLKLRFSEMALHLLRKEIEAS